MLSLHCRLDDGELQAIIDAQMSDFSSFGAKLPPQPTEQSEEDTTTAAVEDVTEETDYNNVEATLHEVT